MLVDLLEVAAEPALDDPATIGLAVSVKPCVSRPILARRFWHHLGALCISHISSCGWKCSHLDLAIRHVQLPADRVSYLIRRRGADLEHGHERLKLLWRDALPLRSDRRVDKDEGGRRSLCEQRAGHVMRWWLRVVHGWKVLDTRTGGNGDGDERERPSVASRKNVRARERQSALGG